MVESIDLEQMDDVQVMSFCIHHRQEINKIEGLVIELHI